MSRNPYLATGRRAHGRLLLDKHFLDNLHVGVHAIIRYNYICYTFPTDNEGLLIAPASSSEVNDLTHRPPSQRPYAS
jgi:hypothetical protein